MDVYFGSAKIKHFVRVRRSTNMIRIQTPLFATVAALAGLASVPAASHGSDAVVLYSAGIDGILNDSKDTALHAIYSS